MLFIDTVLVAAAMLVGCVVRAPRINDAPADVVAPLPVERSILAMLDTMATGWNEGDLSRYLAGYDDSIVSRGYDGFVIDRSAAEQVMRAGYWTAGRPH